MSVQLYAFTCGEITIPHGFLIEGAKGKLRVPVPAYLIVHPRGRVLFDSGLHLAIQADPLAHMGEKGVRGKSFHFGAERRSPATIPCSGAMSRRRRRASREARRIPRRGSTQRFEPGETS
jgi:hypothetical protein